jgi:hypothetical protein
MGLKLRNADQRIGGAIYGKAELDSAQKTHLISNLGELRPQTIESGVF